jgi:hypothetical protein
MAQSTLKFILGSRLVKPMRNHFSRRYFMKHSALIVSACMSFPL